LKFWVRPDPVVAAVLGANAWQLFAPENLACPLVLTLAASLALYGTALRMRCRPMLAAGLVAAALALWWGLADPPLHADDRYDLRLLLVGGVPLLLIGAGWHAAGRSMPRLSPQGWLGALLVVTAVHAGETARFAWAWQGYLSAVRALAAGETADPTLGSPAFVSADRLPARFAPFAWSSTTPYLSVLVSDGFQPHRLVVDPSSGYDWFDCATATANAQRPAALPAATRAMVRDHACRQKQPVTPR
jgi:hypothetical protein